MSSREDFYEIERQVGFISLLSSIKKGRLPNSNLIVCRDEKMCSRAIAFLAKQILDQQNLDACCDFFKISPIASSQQITVDQIRELRSEMYLSPKACSRKVVAIFNIENMNHAAANAFLKILEEPPSDTVIFLTASNLHSIFPTIQSRCSITRFASLEELYSNQEIAQWLNDYVVWLTALFDQSTLNHGLLVLNMYKLLSQFGALLDELCEKFGDSSSKPEITRMMFFAIELQTADFFRKNLKFIKNLPKIIDCLEDSVSLASLNVNAVVCIENFLLKVLQMVCR